MRVAAVEVRNLRVLRQIGVELSPGANWVVGPNGSGKSSLLEALYMLGSGRSFRSFRFHDVVTRGESSLRVVGETVSGEGLIEEICVDYSTNTRLRVSRGGLDIRAASELAANLPIVAVTPESYRLVTDGADLRRRIIDRLLFHVKPDYMEKHQRYRRALRQRNAAIRSRASNAELNGWSEELASAGNELTRQRCEYLVRAIPTMKTTVDTLLDVSIDINFYRGWNSSDSLEGVYGQTLASDRQRGFTQAGPHRADLRFTVEGRPVQHLLSRGETKMFVAAVALAQVKDLAAVLGFPPLVVVDDLASELDTASRHRCLSELRKTGAQLLLSAIPGHVLADADLEDGRVFHVEQGQITKVI